MNMAMKVMILAIIITVGIQIIFRLLSKFADGVREVLVAYDQKGKDLTINDIKQAYRKGRNMVNMSVPEE